MEQTSNGNPHQYGELAFNKDTKTTDFDRERMVL
jgi:hypothetical protein